MPKKIDKKALEEAVDLLINESPLSALRGAIGGVKSAGQNMAGNFRVGQAKSQADQFAKKVNRQWDKNGEKIKQIADKMMDSKNDDVAATGGEIEQIASDAENTIRNSLDKMVQSLPTAVIGGQMGPTRNRTAEENKVGIDWDHLGIDPLHLTDKQLAAVYRTEIMFQKQGKSVNKTPPHIVRGAVTKMVEKELPPEKAQVQTSVKGLDKDKNLKKDASPLPGVANIKYGKAGSQPLKPQSPLVPPPPKKRLADMDFRKNVKKINRQESVSMNSLMDYLDSPEQIKMAQEKISSTKGRK